MAQIAEIHNLKKYYSGKAVLDISELYLEKGTSYAVIGPNGSGKTTLLRILAGILQPDEGSVHIMTNSIGYMPQKPYAFSFSVRRNVRLAVQDKKDADSKALRALEKVGLGSMAECRGDRLSGGETQRMAFARILSDFRELILLDEPTSAADIEGTVKMEEALSEYVRETGCTLLFTTHMPSQAAALAQKVIFIENGQIAEIGEAKQVLFSPVSKSAGLFLSHWRL